MTSLLILLSQHIEQERRDIEVEGFVVEEQFAQQTQVLTVELLTLAVNFED